MKLVILGGIGDGLNIPDLAEQIGGIQIIGYLNDFEKKGNKIGEYEVIDTIENWKNLDEDILFSFPLHRYYYMELRYNKLKNLNIPLSRFATLIHPKANVSRKAQIGYGVTIYPFVNINHSCIIGNFASIRAGANIGHESILGEFNYIGPNAVLSGYTKTAEGVYIAPNATINPLLELQKFSMVGSNSVIYKNVEEYQIYQGNPARFIGKTNEQNV